MKVEINKKIDENKLMQEISKLPNLSSAKIVRGEKGQKVLEVESELHLDQITKLIDENAKGLAMSEQQKKTWLENALESTKSELEAMEKEWQKFAKQEDKKLSDECVQAKKEIGEKISSIDSEIAKIKTSLSDIQAQHKEAMKKAEDAWREKMQAMENEFKGMIHRLKNLSELFGKATEIIKS